mmetsp:Transcript_27703/g.33841  ORF Transcript_27703/g.33841 Transcript_27703/m.33841 type:complete len:224 (-) Transcript_27703:16-687(-)
MLSHAADTIVAHRQRRAEHLGLDIEDTKISRRSSCHEEVPSNHATDVLPLQPRGGKLHGITIQGVAHGPHVELHHMVEHLTVVGGTQLVRWVARAEIQDRTPNAQEAGALSPSVVDHLTSGHIPNEDHLIGPGGDQKAAIRRETNTKNRMGKAVEVDVATSIVKVPDHHRRHGAFSVGGPQLPTGQQFAVQRHVDGRYVVVVASEELLLMRIIDILNDDCRSC